MDRIFTEAFDGAFSAFCADLDFLNTVPGLELFRHPFCVCSRHHIFPDVLHIGAALLGPVIVEASPHAAGEGGRISYEPGIPDIRRRPALAGEVDDRIAFKIRLHTGAGKHRILQRAGKELRRIFGNDSPRRLLFLDQDIPVVIQDLRIEDGLRILAAPRDGRIGRSHLKIRNAAVGPAEGKGFHFVIFCQRRDPEFPDHVPDRIHPDLVKALQGHDIPRLCDRRLYRDIALVGTVEIMDLRPVGIGAGRVRDHGAECHRAAVKGCRVLPDDLDGRSRLAHHRSGAVQQKICIFLTAASDQSTDLAGLRIHEDQRRLLVGCIVVGIVDDLACKLLHAAVFRRTDRQSSPVNEIPRLLLTAPGRRHNVMQNTVDHGIFKICHDLLRAPVRAHFRDPGVNVVAGRLIALLLRDKSKLKHFIQNVIPPLRIGFRVRDRIIPGRIPGDSRDHSALGQGEIGNIFIEIIFCRCLNAPVPSAEVDRIQVVFKDPGLVDVHFQRDCQVLLLDLPLDLVKKCRLIHPVRKNIVLKELLRDGACSLRKIPFCNSLVKGTHDPPGIDPEMLVEPFVLDRDDCLLKGFRHLRQFYINTVRSLAGEREDDISVPVQDIGPVSVRHCVQNIDGRRPDDTVSNKDGSRCDDSKKRDEYHTENGFYFTSRHGSGPPFPAQYVQNTHKYKHTRHGNQISRLRMIL